MSSLGGKGPLTIAVLSSEAIISLIFIGLRMYVRHFVKGKIGADDHVLVATWVLQAAFTILFIVSSLHGFGQHVDVLSPSEIRIATVVELAGQTVVSLAMGLSKTAAALFLMRIVVHAWHRWFLWFWIASMNFLAVLLGIAVFAQCQPARGLWDSRVTIEQCPINMTMVAYVMCSWSAAMDFVLAIFPWYFLWELKMKKKEKITICVSLSLGIVAGICGIFRTTGLYVLSQTEDYLYATAGSVMWTSSELMVTVICISVPAFRPLFQRLFHGYVEHSSGDDYYNQSGSKSGAGRSRSGTAALVSASRKGGGGGGPSVAVRSASRRHPGDLDDDSSLEGDVAGNAFQMNTMCRASGGGGGGAAADGNAKSDNDSDKSILAKGQGIHRVQEFTVSYDAKNGGMN